MNSVTASSQNNSLETPNDRVTPAAFRESLRGRTSYRTERPARLVICQMVSGRQWARAVAMVRPEGGEIGAGRGNKSEEISDFSQRRLQQARFVYHRVSNLWPKLVAGEVVSVPVKLDPCKRATSSPTYAELLRQTAAPHSDTPAFDRKQESESRIGTGSIGAGGAML